MPITHLPLTRAASCRLSQRLFDLQEFLTEDRLTKFLALTIPDRRPGEVWREKDINNEDVFDPEAIARLGAGVALIHQLVLAEKASDTARAEEVERLLAQLPKP